MWLNFYERTLINLDLVSDISKVNRGVKESPEFTICITFCSDTSSNGSYRMLSFDSESERDKKFQEILEFISEGLLVKKI